MVSNSVGVSFCDANNSSVWESTPFSPRAVYVDTRRPFGRLEPRMRGMLPVLTRDPCYSPQFQSRLSPPPPQFLPSLIHPLVSERCHLSPSSLSILSHLFRFLLVQAYFLHCPRTPPWAPSTPLLGSSVLLSITLLLSDKDRSVTYHTSALIQCNSPHQLCFGLFVFWQAKWKVWAVVCRVFFWDVSFFQTWPTFLFPAVLVHFRVSLFRQQSSAHLPGSKSHGTQKYLVQSKHA